MNRICTNLSEAITYIEELETEQKRFEWLKTHLGNDFIVVEVSHNEHGANDDEGFWYGHLGCDVGYALDDLENKQHGPFKTFNDAIEDAMAREYIAKVKHSGGFKCTHCLPGETAPTQHKAAIDDARTVTDRELETSIDDSNDDFGSRAVERRNLAVKTIIGTLQPRQ